jgi:hypothetical protein
MSTPDPLETTKAAAAAVESSLSDKLHALMARNPRIVALAALVVGFVLGHIL